MATQDKLLLLADGTERTIMTAEHLRQYLFGKEMKKVVIFHVARSMPEEWRELAQEPACAALIERLKGQVGEAQKTVLENLERAKRILVEGGMPEDSVEIRLTEEKGGVVPDIIEEAGRGYRAVVMRRRGMGTLKNIVVGSVALKLLQALTFIPIILVGRAPGVRRVLLAVDSSGNSKKAVDFAASTLCGQDYEICVFHAVMGLGEIAFDPEADAVRTLPQAACDEEGDGVDVFKQKIGRLLVGARDRLVQAGFDPAKVSVKVRCGAHGGLADAIVHEAETGGYGTVIMGRRGLSRVQSFFLGRVSHGVVYEGKELTVWVV